VNKRHLIIEKFGLEDYRVLGNMAAYNADVESYRELACESEEPLLWDLKFVQRETIKGNFALPNSRHERVAKVVRGVTSIKKLSTNVLIVVTGHLLKLSTKGKGDVQFETYSFINDVVGTSECTGFITDHTCTLKYITGINSQCELGMHDIPSTVQPVQSPQGVCRIAYVDNTILYVSSTGL